ncbi:MAG: lytic murein transglycosylase B [Gammaproteobacteria bacterium]
MTTRLLSATCCLLGLACQPLPATAADYRDHEELHALATELAREDGMDPAAVVALLGNAQRKQAILDAIARPAERTLDWAEYRPQFVEPRRIAQGVEFMRRHADTLALAEREHGVPAEIIAAIIGVETRYGRNKGNWRVIDALATLAFDYPPRAPFFRQQLKEFVRLEKTAHIRLADAKGSYAGAMGYPQFMPSSYRNFAVDYDGDGVIDLINNPVDAIGSVANYLRLHGWRSGQPVAAMLQRHGEGTDSNADSVTNRGLEPQFTVAEIARAGLVAYSCGDAPPAVRPYCGDPAADEKATAWKLAGENGTEYWLGLQNFYVLTRYNRSEKYALAVLHLAQEIGRQTHARKPPNERD